MTDIPKLSSSFETWILHSTDNRDLRNEKRYPTSIERIMSNHGSREENAKAALSENVEGEIPEFQTLTQEAVIEEIRGFIASLTRQLEDLTPTVQGMTTSMHPNSYPRTELGITSGTAMPHSDIHHIVYQNLTEFPIFQNTLNLNKTLFSGCKF